MILQVRFLPIRPPFQARPIPKASYLHPLPNPVHFPAQKPKHSLLERLELLAFFEVSDTDAVSGYSGLCFRQVRYETSSTLCASSVYVCSAYRF